MTRRRAAFVFVVATFAYLIAIVQRSSLGVAAVEATERFEVAATVLSLLAVTQVAVYAALQIPVGALIDRYGPRLLLVVGALLMASGQTILALSVDIGTAIIGRMLVGAGDAMTFPAGIRLLAQWYEGRRLPFVIQIFSQVGQVGQLLSAFPLMVLLHSAGWLPAYLSAASLSIVAVIAILAASAAGPAPVPHEVERLGFITRLHHILEALRRPGTQIGFWAHYSMQSSISVFALMWGFPFLTVALGLSSGTATLLLSLPVLVGVVVGPVLGILSARFPFRRSNLLLGILAVMAVAWILVLAWPGVPPLWLVVTLIALITIGGPSSMIGFDYARMFNPARQMGSANGIVNVGGFLATFVMMFLIGVVLDALRDRTPGVGLEGLYSLESFRLAFLVQFPVIGFGVVMLLLTRRRIRRRMREDEGIVVAPLWVALTRRLRARRLESSRRREPGMQ